MVVFDINWNSVEDLYGIKNVLPPRLLFQMMEYKQAKRLGWKNGDIKKVSNEGDADVYRVRYAFPPGWFITFGWIVMPFIANRVRRLSDKLLKTKVQIAVYVSPHYYPLKKALDVSKSVYHPVDDYAHYWPKRAFITENREAAMVRDCDITICAGYFLHLELKRKYPECASKIFHIQNPLPESFLAPEAVKARLPGIASPILGYIGGIHGRLNVRAVQMLSKAIPSAKIEIYSQDSPGRDLFDGYSNIVLHPPLQRAQMPQIIRSFDACLLPQEASYFNLCASPRKLYEYLGSSKPIVTLNTPEATNLGSYVYNATSESDFVNLVQMLVDKGEPDNYSLERWKLAHQFTPIALATKLNELIKAVM